MPKSSDFSFGMGIEITDSPDTSVPGLHRAADFPEHSDAMFERDSEGQDDVICMINSWAEQPHAPGLWDSMTLAPGVTWASQENQEERGSANGDQNSNHYQRPESAQHTTLPLEDGAIPEARGPADGLEPPHPSHARLARSAAEALAQAASTTTGSQATAALPKSPLELLRALERAPRHEEEQTSEQQPFATATRASQESAGSHNDEAQAASLRRQQAAPAANVPSHEQAEYGLRSHLEAFEAGNTAAPVLSSQLSQDIERSDWRTPAADDVVPDFAELDL